MGTEIQQAAEPKKINMRILKITDRESLQLLEKERSIGEHIFEFLPWADGTPYVEIAENVIPGTSKPWSVPLFYAISTHRNTIGIRNVCIKAQEYLNEMKKETQMDVLSISACMGDGKVILRVLVRQYIGDFNPIGFFDYVNDEIIEEKRTENKDVGGALVIPDVIKNFKYTDEDVRKHDAALKKQKMLYDNATKEKPYLNMVGKYIPEKLPMPEDTTDLIYDLKTSDMKMETIAEYDHFMQVFKEIMSYVNGVEYYHYVNAMSGDETEDHFMSFLEQYVIDKYVNEHRLDVEDLKPMMKKLHNALFEFYILQDLINDPNVTDIKVTAPDSIRARVKGKAYISNVSFIDTDDYIRFVNAIAVKNGIIQTIPEQTFTDKRDKNYILRVTLYAKYVSSVGLPYLHLRKINRKKPLSKELMEAGMFDEKIRDYLLDCGKTSRGVVFAGPPGSGKTVILNWFLEEAYEQSAEILIIQENDELFAYRKGVMIQHVVNYSRRDEQPVNLEELGQLALVAGANVFIIGEAKGAEICSAITLSNSGCRTAITIHSPSSTETIDKMADLAMRGYAKDYDQAMRMIRSFQTVVYLEGYKVREISEITGYNESTHTMDYRYIYRRDA